MASQALGTGLGSMLKADLTGGRDLVDLTTGVVLRNLLEKTKGRNKTLYAALTVIVPYFLLTSGALGLLKQLTELPSHVKRIGSTHPLNQDILQWLVSKGLGGKPKSLTLFDPETDNERHSDSRFPWRYEDDEEDEKPKEHEEPEDRKPKPLKFVPGYGKYTFFWSHRVFTVERKQPPANAGERRGSMIDMDTINPAKPVPLYISCYPTFNGTKPIEDFLDHVRGFAAPPSFECTTVFRPEYLRSRGAGWAWKGTKRPIRPLESIALDEEKKYAVLDDISTYLTPECERWYSSRGIPYRRGMLLYGPPGTGKTSFSVALAGAFSLNLYVLSLSDPLLNDGYLEQLFDYLPKRCSVLLEDVDSAGLRREALEAKDEDDKKKEEEKDKPRNRPYLPKQIAGITLSGMLNVLDGPASRDGRIVLMTSNAPDSLDSALIRPGRCDRKILFGYAGIEICEKLFTHIYCSSPEERAAGQQETAAEHDVPALAKEFASKIPAGSPISPAEVQGYLMIHRDDPLAAIAGAEAFAQQIIDIKARGAKVEAFDNEIESKVADAQGKEKSKSGTKAKPEDNTKSESTTEPEVESGAEPKSPILPMSRSDRGDRLSLPSSPNFGAGWLDLQMRRHGIDPTDSDAMLKWRDLVDRSEAEMGSGESSPVGLADFMYDSGDEEEGEYEGEGSDYGEDEEDDKNGDGDDLEGVKATGKVDAKAARREKALDELLDSAPSSAELAARLLAAQEQIRSMSARK